MVMWTKSNLSWTKLTRRNGKQNGTRFGKINMSERSTSYNNRIDIVPRICIKSQFNLYW